MDSMAERYRDAWVEDPANRETDVAAASPRADRAAGLLIELAAPPSARVSRSNSEETLDDVVVAVRVRLAR